MYSIHTRLSVLFTLSIWVGSSDVLFAFGNDLLRALSSKIAIVFHVSYSSVLKVEKCLDCGYLIHCVDVIGYQEVSSGLEK